MKRKMSYLRHETHRQVHITPYKRHNRAAVVRRICKDASHASVSMPQAHLYRIRIQTRTTGCHNVTALQP